MISFSPNTRIKSAEVNANFTEVWPTNWTTFTPAVAGVSVAGAGTYVERVGLYSVIGDILFFGINLTWSAHTGSGNAKITGLPVASTSSVASPVNIGYLTEWNIGTTNFQVVGRIPISSTEIYFFNVVNNAGEVSLALDTVAGIYVSGWYPVA